MPIANPAESLIIRPVVVSVEPQDGQAGVLILNMQIPPNYCAVRAWYFAEKVLVINSGVNMLVIFKLGTFL